ncbi:AraC family transcriptional regulator [Bacteroidia bacterium]|nr:AraC family transcriptional regulator [Bacteroidia bacterium]GHV70888.1 AraC family transcriptional regulator [Bacteroidia bacterium]
MKEFQKEITPLASDDLFIVLNHNSAKFDYPVHFHTDFEINLVMDTYGQRIVGDSIEDFSNLDLVMIGPNIPHAWKGEIVENNHVVTIQFSDKLLNFPILEKRIFSNIKNLLYESQRGIVFSEKTMLLIKEKILTLTKQQGFQTVLEFFSILNELSISDRRILVSNQFDGQAIVRTSKSRRIAKVCEYIEKNYKTQITLKEISSLVNMSESAFSHFFKKKTNTSFKDYLTNIRITQACQLLTKTTHSIAEICFACGFNNLSNFIRIFKKKKGTTPSDYRILIEQLLIKY